MFRCSQRFLSYEIKDVTAKALIDRARVAKIKQGVCPEDITNDLLAKECGLLPADCVSASELQQKKEKLMMMLGEQRLKRIARREAFLEWQAGQREKGAAHRLVRQAKTAEKYKRQHYHSQKGRILSTAYLDASGKSSNSVPWDDSVVSDLCRSAEVSSSTEFLRRRSESSPIRLSLSKK